MNSRERDALDRHITGNYGEDQFKDEEEPTATLDLALTAAEKKLRRLLLTNKRGGGMLPEEIADLFKAHVETHLAEELENIREHGHVNDDPADAPRRRRKGKK